jgi:formyl-CoA transferase
MSEEHATASPPIEGLRVIEASTIIAGPMLGMILGDFGAEVIKVEHPKGDPLRETGHQKDGIGLWWKYVGRNKRCITLNFGLPKGQEILRKLVQDADVLIENFRPGTMERTLAWSWCG